AASAVAPVTTTQVSRRAANSAAMQGPPTANTGGSSPVRAFNWRATTIGNASMVSPFACSPLVIIRMGIGVRKVSASRSIAQPTPAEETPSTTRSGDCAITSGKRVQSWARVVAGSARPSRGCQPLPATARTMASSRGVPTRSTSCPSAPAGTAIADPITPAPRMAILATQRGSGSGVEEKRPLRREGKVDRRTGLHLRTLVGDGAGLGGAEPGVNMRLRAGRLQHADDGGQAQTQRRPQMLRPHAEHDFLPKLGRAARRRVNENAVGEPHFRLAVRARDL